MNKKVSGPRESLFELKITSRKVENRSITDYYFPEASSFLTRLKEVQENLEAIFLTVVELRRVICIPSVFSSTGPEKTESLNFVLQSQ